MTKRQKGFQSFVRVFEKAENIFRVFEDLKVFSMFSNLACGKYKKRTSKNLKKAFKLSDFSP